MKKFGIIVVVIVLITIPAIKKFKNFASIAKTADAKLILKCVKENPECLEINYKSVEEVKQKCPSVTCIKNSTTKYYNNIQLITLNDNENLIILRGKLPKGDQNNDDVWVMTQNGQLIHCIDGTGMDDPDSSEYCNNL